MGDYIPGYALSQDAFNRTQQIQQEIALRKQAEKFLQDQTLQAQQQDQMGQEGILTMLRYMAQQQQQAPQSPAPGQGSVPMGPPQGPPPMGALGGMSQMPQQGPMAPQGPPQIAQGAPQNAPPGSMWLNPSLPPAQRALAMQDFQRTGGAQAAQQPPAPAPAPPAPPAPQPWRPGGTAPPELGGGMGPPAGMGNAAPGGVMPAQPMDPVAIWKNMEAAGIPDKARYSTLMKAADMWGKQQKEQIANLLVESRLDKERLAWEKEKRESLRNEILGRQADERIDLEKQRLQQQAAKGQGGGGQGGEPGGIGSQTVQDKDTGQKYVLNNRTGKAWKFNDDSGKYEAISPNAVPKNAIKIGNIGAMGARESVFTQRQLLAANEAVRDLKNVSELPVTASAGVFGGRKQGPGLFDATKEVLANKMTTEEVQLYNTMATGFQRSLATIEAAGLMPSGTLTHQMEGVMLREGDTNLVKLSKLAQIRQIVDAGMEVVESNPRVSEAEKEKARDIRKQMEEAVPFTQQQVIKFMSSPNKAATMRSLMVKKGGAASDVREFKTEEEAKAAGLAPGTKIKVGGVEGTWQ